MTVANPIQPTSWFNLDKSILRVSFITFLAICTFCGAVFINSGNDPLTFAFIGTRFSEGNPNGTTGYDGQFVYFIARDGADAVPYLDGPTLRYQRIIYPLLGRALALGNAELVPWTLLLINIAAHTAGTTAIAWLLFKKNAPVWGALIYGFWIGNIFAIRFDLNEPLCFTLSLLAIIAYSQERYRWTVFLLILATLTKELGAVFAAGLALHCALTRMKWRWASLVVGAPIIAFLSWWGVMKLWLGTLPTQYPAAKIHLIPFEGLFTVLNDNPLLSTGERTLQFLLSFIWLGLPTIVMLALAIWTIWKNRRLSMTTALLLACCGFVMVMPDVSWQDLLAAQRIGTVIVLSAILFIGEYYPSKMKWIAGLWGSALLILLILTPLWLNPS
ncbi:MAG: hypothetical protein RLP44_30315 [Aggregatilineales bacterium]